jgi:Glycosyltransferase
VLVGGSADDAWLTQLKNMAKGLRVEFAPNISHEELINLYGGASIYWHAAGYQVDQTLFPDLTEHFGISIVEAVSMGAVPFVVPRGGAKEIVVNDSLHWNSIDELVDKTIAHIKNPVPLYTALKQINVDAFTKQQFASKLTSLL